MGSNQYLKSIDTIVKTAEVAKIEALIVIYDRTAKAIEDHIRTLGMQNDDRS